MFARLPKSTVAQVLGKQVLRSGTSIGANYREAHRGRSKAEFIAKVGDSLRELEEDGLLARTVGWENRHGFQAGTPSPGSQRNLCDDSQTVERIVIPTS